MKRQKQVGSGRKAGTPNKITTAARSAFQQVFDGIGGVDAFTQWAKQNPETFYRLYARLIPMDSYSNLNFTVVCAIPATPNSIKSLSNNDTKIIDVTPEATTLRDNV